MKTLWWLTFSLVLAASTFGGAHAAPAQARGPGWVTVVNDADYMPTPVCDPVVPGAGCRHFNSFNQPSVNAAGLVVFRARSRGGGGTGEPVQGIYTRDMAAAGPIVRVLDRNTVVPPPDNRGSVFTESPSFPRIDIDSSTIAVRGNHPPVWQVVDDTGAVIGQAGTSGIYTDPFGVLVTGAARLGAIPYFRFLQVPGSSGTSFDVFPGAPAVTDGDVIVFKGNYTRDGVSRTGVYYRELTDAPLFLPDRNALSPAGGDLPVVLIANNVDTPIPGTDTVFGSVAPPSAAGRMAVFAGFDDEDAPTLGGIYRARLDGPRPALGALVSIGGPVPGVPGARFNRLGEALSFNGRLVAFWGAWGTDTMSRVLPCPTEGNRDRIAYCAARYPEGFTVQVPVHQGIFVYDLRTRQLHTVATSPGDFRDFLYWNYSGHVPGTGEGDGEPARWRAGAFMAVSSPAHGNGARFRVAFKARTGPVAGGRSVNPVDGIYLGEGPGPTRLRALVTTGIPGTRLDPEAFDPESGAPLPVTELGIERDAFRGGYLVIDAGMGNDENGWAGIYMATLPR